MTLFKSISSISNGSINSSGNKLMTASSFGINSVGNNNVACGGFDDFGGLGGGFGGYGSGTFGGGCSGRNVNVINVDIDIGRRRRHCC